jgi:hypothetical protein
MLAQPRHFTQSDKHSSARVPREEVGAAVGALDTPTVPHEPCTLCEKKSGAPWWQHGRVTGSMLAHPRHFTQSDKHSSARVSREEVGAAVGALDTPTVTHEPCTKLGKKKLVNHGGSMEG